MITFHPIAADGMPEKFPGPLAGAAFDACAATAVMARGRPYRKPWVGYLVAANGTAIGTCAFKGPPADDRVTVGYQTFSGHEGRGYATAMLNALVRIARTVRPGLTIVAQTLPHEGASTRVLEKGGFEYIGMVEHPEDGLVWEWVLPPQI